MMVIMDNDGDKDKEDDDGHPCVSGGSDGG